MDRRGVARGEIPILGPAVRVDARKVVAVLGTVAVVLVVLNLGVNALKLVVDDRSLSGVAPLFELKSERNLPTFFSGFLHVLNAQLLFLAWMVRRRSESRQVIWLLLSGVFLFLAADEMLEIHELLIEPLRAGLDTSGLLYDAWVLVYGVAALAIGALFFPVWWRLRGDVKWLLAAAAATFVSGAIIAEMVGGAVYERSDETGGALYAALYTVEETLEMAGSIMFTYALLALIGLGRGGVTVHIPRWRGIGSD